MSRTKIGIAAGVVLAGTVIAGGSAIANAATTPTPNPSSSGAAPAAPAAPGEGQGPAGKGPGHAHTPVTGDELAKVKAAVKAKDSAITVTTVQKDPDGSYDIDGTKAGAKVRLDASADLKTVSEAKQGRGPRDGGPGKRGPHTPATADQTAKVKAAVKAKDSAITVTEVVKDADGSFDAHGTKAGAHVHVDVSADYATVTVSTGPKGGPKGDGPRGTGPDGDRPAPDAPAPSTSPSDGATTPSSSASSSATSAA